MLKFLLFFHKREIEGFNNVKSQISFIIISRKLRVKLGFGLLCWQIASQNSRHKDGRLSVMTRAKLGQKVILSHVKKEEVFFLSETSVNFTNFALIF